MVKLHIKLLYIPLSIQCNVQNEYEAFWHVSASKLLSSDVTTSSISSIDSYGKWLFFRRYKQYPSQSQRLIGLCWDRSSSPGLLVLQISCSHGLTVEESNNNYNKNKSNNNYNNDNYTLKSPLTIAGHHGQCKEFLLEIKLFVKIRSYFEMFLMHILLNLENFIWNSDFFGFANM